MTKHRQICGNPNCESCSRKIRFDMPPEIPEAVKRGQLALFAGAGISTEGNGVFPRTFYDEVAAELQPTPTEDLSFPALMSLFCKERGRGKLLLEIKKRFEYLHAFPEVQRSASRFHQELSTVPFIDEIFTTNWDDLFERECHAIPIVTGQDFVFWNFPGRKVFKLHGSITNIGSIIATEQDYKRCVKKLRSGMVGSALKMALATRTILFVGYSAKDRDFLQALRLVRKEMGSVAPRMYAVTFSDEDKERLEALGLTTIVTDASFFIQQLKSALISDGTMLDDSWQQDVEDILGVVDEVHLRLGQEFDCVKFPTLVYTLCYQDGLKHGLERLLSKARAGECSHECHLTGPIQAYDTMRRNKMKSRRYQDVAYIEGYSNALILPLLPAKERASIPLFYIFGSKCEIKNFKSFVRALRKSKRDHPGAYAAASRLVKRRGNDPEIVFHHTPFL